MTVTDPDYMRDEYSPLGFVIDYIDRRLNADGCEWWLKPDRAYDPEPAHFALYEVCRVFEKKNSSDLTVLVKALIQDDNEMDFTFNRFDEVVDLLNRNSDEGRVQMPYGRLVALVAFAGFVALKLVHNNCQQTISDLALYTGRYIEKGIKLQWPEAGRSWAGFLSMTKVVLEKNARSEEIARLCAERRKRMIGAAVAVAATFGIGLFAWRHYRQ